MECGLKCESVWTTEMEWLKKKNLGREQQGGEPLKPHNRKMRAGLKNMGQMNHFDTPVPLYTRLLV